MSKGMSEHIDKILKTLQTSPGVYQMKDGEGKVIYVGKAKNLKSRVNSYFLKTNDLTMAKRQMVAKIRDIEVIHCATEVEALVLETNLIKHLTPKYNILMKDDKNLAYLKITNSPVPELIKTRQKIKDGGEYFGPFTGGVEESVRALRRAFKIRNCRVKFAHKNQSIQHEGKLTIVDKAGKTLPCMDYYIGLCPGPCLLEDQGLREHERHIQSAREFLRGNSSDLIKRLEDEMRERASRYEFEEAQKVKTSLEALKMLFERQKVRDAVDGNIDIFVKYEKYEKIYIGLTQIRDGRIIAVFRHEVNLGADDGEDIALSFLARQYSDDGDIPDILILPTEPDDSLLNEFLATKKVILQVPKIGTKMELLEFTLNQVRDYAYKREMEMLETRTLTREHMANILDRLSYSHPKKGELSFECYDISHTDGHFTYASRVCIVNGKPDTMRYKKYKIRSLQDGQIDDFASHREVMYRRTLEGLEQHNFPHLIIIDGGKGQLSSALSGIKAALYDFAREHDIKDMGTLILPHICSIAKREEEVFLPGEKSSILFEKGSPELMVIQKARDESHRFSITANKSARMKSMKKNILEEIPGIGPVTRKKLLKSAGSIEDIRTLSQIDLEKICTKTQIEALRDHGII